MWLNDEEYFQGRSGLLAEGYSIHFREDFLGLSFLELGSTEHFLTLFRNARRGIRFNELSFQIAERIKELINEKESFNKLVKWLNILHLLAKHQNISLLTNDGYQHSAILEGADKTHEFIFKNFNKSIRLADVAKIQGMNESAFSRYFKRIHRKTFSRYLIELRVGYACKLLVEKKSSVSAICYESGFNNLSNFNKQFKKIMNMNPTEYVQMHQ
nr:AraC family transcriptional regulator [Portibacter lacus]